jgi:hypothetical protein
MKRLRAALLALAVLVLAVPATVAAPSARFGTWTTFNGGLVKPGTRPLWAGILLPNQPGRTVSLQRRFGSSWRTVAKVATTHGGRGFAVRPATPPPFGYTTWRLCLGSSPCTPADKLFVGRNHTVADFQPTSMSPGVSIGALTVDGVRGRGLKFTAPGDGFAEYDLKGKCRDGGASYGVNDDDGDNLLSATLTILLDGRVVGRQPLKYGPLSQQLFPKLWGVKTLRIEGSGTTEQGTSHYGLVRGDVQCAF